MRPAGLSWRRLENHEERRDVHMRKILLGTAAMLAFAVAGGERATAQPLPEFAFAAALGINNAAVAGLNGSILYTDSARMSGSVQNNTGVAQVSQNTGAGAAQQNAAAVAVVDGIPGTPGIFELNAVLAIASNTGAVAGTANLAIGGSAASGMSDSVRGNRGVTQANQNAGAGALQQNAASLATLGLCNNCPDQDLSVSIAVATNQGSVTGLNLSGFTASSAAMSGSVVGNMGLTQVSQNAGAGALSQNSVALGAIIPQAQNSVWNVR
jgi:hypothetical protein